MTLHKWNTERQHTVISNKVIKGNITISRGKVMEQMEFVHDVEANRREETDKRESEKNFLCSADGGGSKC